MTLFYGHSVTRELVIWREPRYFQRIINSSYKKCREMKAGGRRTWMSRLCNFPRDGDFLIRLIQSISIRYDMREDVYFECVHPITLIIDRVHQMHDVSWE